MPLSHKCRDVQRTSQGGGSAASEQFNGDGFDEIAVASEYGGVDCIAVTSGEVVPVPSDSQVLIRVECASINPVDWKMLSGYLALIESGGANKRRIRGFDASGVISATGKDCMRLKPGDKVMCMLHFSQVTQGQGSFAEFVAVDEKYVTKQPAALTAQQAAGLPLCSLTSYHALKTYASMEPGQTVLIVGASSGTGLMGVQLAKALGAARVIGVCSSKNTDRVLQVGADEVIDYSKESWWQSTSLCRDKVDIVYDCVGGVETWTNSHAILKPWGKFVTIAGDEQSPLRPLKLLSFGAKMLGRKMVSFCGSPSYFMVSTFDNSHAFLDNIAALAQDGKLSVLIDSEHEFTTQGIRDALQRSMTQRAVGKIIVRVRRE